MGKIFKADRKPHSLKIQRQCIGILAAFCLSGVADAADTIPEAASQIGATRVAKGKEWMAVTANPLATETAANILKDGGNAIDAAIAAQMVLGLVEPQSSGIGGGGFLLYWNAKENSLTSYDGRETAPKSINPNHFLTDDGKPLGFPDAIIGGHAVGTPGLLAMLEKAHVEHGKTPWPLLFDPAITLAKSGFTVSPRLNKLLSYIQQSGSAVPSKAFKEMYLPGGAALRKGSVLKNPEYAKSLEQIALQGSAVFYKGAIAEKIVDAVQNNPDKPGLLSLADLQSYKPVVRKPLCKEIAPYKVCGANLPASGPLAVMQILTMLNELPGHEGLAYNSAAFYHRLAEASKIAFADRNAYTADPDYVSINVKGLLDQAYLKSRADSIPLLRSGNKAEPGEISKMQQWQPGLNPELPSTSHLSIVDAEGNIVSMTSSIETAFGSRVMVSGFLLNNQLSDFSFAPADEEGLAIANRVEAGKRPRSSMSPIIVFDLADRPLLVVGSPGGSRIIPYVAKTIGQHLYQRASLEAAVKSPHIVNLNGTTEVEENNYYASQLGKALESLGHDIKTANQTSGIHAIRIYGAYLEGVADPRREGSAYGE